MDNGYYDLGNATKVAWADDTTLNEEQRQLIRRCLPKPDLIDDENGAPGEHHLDSLQRVLAACDEISKFEEGDDGWLTEKGRAFPSAIRSFIHRTASYFHESPHFLSHEFLNPLREHILQSRSHVATLNYDELLYRGFIGADVFQGYSCLIDGFTRSGFSETNLERKRPDHQSFYLHLHGSPLYFEDSDGNLRKAELRKLPVIHGYSSTHIVLTEVKHKASVIQSSEILRVYWKRLKEAIQEVEGVMLVGYGGGDTHLNELVRANFSGKQVEVVERDKPEYGNLDDRQSRHAFWKRRLGQAHMLHWQKNICEFSRLDWLLPDKNEGKFFHKRR